MRLPPLSRPLLALLMIASLSACNGASSSRGTAPELTKKERGFINLAESMERSGDIKGAEKLYKNAIKASGGNVTAHLSLADMYFRQGRQDDAAKILATAEEIRPNDIKLNQALGKLNVRQGKPQEALNHFSRGLKASPNDFSLLNGKGVALDMLDRHEEAVASYQHALKFGTGEDETLANNNLALSYIMSGEYDKAIELLTALVQDNDSAVIRQNLALAYGLKGDMPNAKKWSGKDLDGQKLKENIRFYRQYHDNQILKAVTPMAKPSLDVEEAEEKAAAPTE